MNARIQQANLGIIGVTVIGFVLAATLGVMIASGDYLPLLYIVCLFGFVFYIVYLQKFTWHIALSLCYLGFYYRPLGFEFGPLELSCALGALLGVIMVWQKLPRERVGVLESKSFNLLRLTLLVWIAYVALHIIYNISDPYRPADFLLKNAIKSYFAPFAPLVMLWYFSGNPAGIRARQNSLRVIAILLLLGLIVNIAITAYGIFFRPIAIDPDADVSYVGTFTIPVINCRDNLFALRVLGPSAVLIGTVMLCLKQGGRAGSSAVPLFLLFLGSIGASLSGGRAAIVTSIAFVSAVLVLTKRYIGLCGLFLVAAMFVLGVNLASDWINRDAPIAVSRPLQWIMVIKNKDAVRSIESSSDWRQGLFSMAITEWQSASRIFWFGRATYGFDVNDLVARRIAGGFESLKETSLRRGATHNLITDLLIAFGLVGCVLYYCVMFSVIRFLWIVYKFTDVPPLARSLSLVCLIASAEYVIYASVGGGFYPIELVWLLIIMIASLYQHRTRNLSDKGVAGPTDHLARHDPYLVR